MVYNKHQLVLLLTLAVFCACKNDKSPVLPGTVTLPLADTSRPARTTLLSTGDQDKAYDKYMSAYCEEILNRLWTASDHAVGKKKPRIAISLGETRAAGFVESTNTIIVEKKAFDLCHQLDPDKFSGALGFLIAHELAHYFQKVYEGVTLPKKTGFYADTSSFLGYNAVPGGYRDEEENADLSGAFNLYLAKIHVDGTAMSELISTLYAAYPRAKNDHKYPTEAVRKSTMQRIDTQFHELCTLYEAAPFFSAFGAHTAAVESYSTILLYYRGKEVYAGRGVALARRALDNMPKTNKKQYIFPLETDWETRLRTKPTTYSASDEDLKAAAADLESALRIDPDYELAALNHLIVKVIKGYSNPDSLHFGKIRASFEQYQTRYGNHAAYYPQALMAYALAHAISPGKSPDLKPKARQMFDTLIRHTKDSSIVHLAQYNLNMMNGQPIKVPMSVHSKTLFDVQKSLGKASLGTTLTPDRILLRSDIKIGLRAVKQVSILVFEYQNERVFLLRAPAKTHNSIQQDIRATRVGSGGVITVLPGEKCGFRAVDGQIREYFQYRIDALH